MIIFIALFFVVCLVFGLYFRKKYNLNIKLVLLLTGPIGILLVANQVVKLSRGMVEKENTEAKENITQEHVISNISSETEAITEVQTEASINNAHSSFIDGSTEKEPKTGLENIDTENSISSLPQDNNSIQDEITNNPILEPKEVTNKAEPDEEKNNQVIKEDLEHKDKPEQVEEFIFDNVEEINDTPASSPVIPAPPVISTPTINNTPPVITNDITLPEKNQDEVLSQEIVSSPAQEEVAELVTRKEIHIFPKQFKWGHELVYCEVCTKETPHNSKARCVICKNINGTLLEYWKTISKPSNNIKKTKNITEKDMVKKYKLTSKEVKELLPNNKKTKQETLNNLDYFFENLKESNVDVRGWLLSNSNNTILLKEGQFAEAGQLAVNYQAQTLINPKAEENKEHNEISTNDIPPSNSKKKRLSRKEKKELKNKPLHTEDELLIKNNKDASQVPEQTRSVQEQQGVSNLSRRKEQKMQKIARKQAAKEKKEQELAAKKEKKMLAKQAKAEAKKIKKNKGGGKALPENSSELILPNNITQAPIENDEHLNTIALNQKLAPALDEIPLKPSRFGKTKTFCTFCQKNRIFDNQAKCKTCGNYNNQMRGLWGLPLVKQEDTTRLEQSTPLAPTIGLSKQDVNFDDIISRNAEGEAIKFRKKENTPTINPPAPISPQESSVHDTPNPTSLSDKTNRLDMPSGFKHCDTCGVPSLPDLYNNCSICGNKLD